MPELRIDESAAKGSFERDGYVQLTGFFDSQEMAEVEENLQRYIREVIPQVPETEVYYEEKGRPDTLKQLQRLHEYDAFFEKLFVGNRGQGLAAMLLGGPVVPKNIQYFNKPPGIGKPTPPHQDGYYFMLVPCEAITLWIALENVDEENGCVRYVTGSHRIGLRSHRLTDTLGFSQGIPDYGTAYDREHEVALRAAPGDLLAHHAVTVHRADGNRSASRTRRALGMVYFRADAKEDAVAQAAYQKRLTEELSKAGKL